MQSGSENRPEDLTNLLRRAYGPEGLYMNADGAKRQVTEGSDVPTSRGTDWRTSGP